MVDTEELCVEEGKWVWVLSASVVCLNDDGNVWDTAVLALSCALRNARLPAARVNGDGVVEAAEGACARARRALGGFPR